MRHCAPSEIREDGPAGGIDALLHEGQRPSVSQRRGAELLASAPLENKTTNAPRHRTPMGFRIRVVGGARPVQRFGTPTGFGIRGRWFIGHFQGRRCAPTLRCVPKALLGFGNVEIWRLNGFHASDCHALNRLRHLLLGEMGPGCDF
jgi:hypothetical protein